MQTVAEIAKGLGVTPQAVYKRVNNTLKTELKPFVQKDATGKTLIMAEGVEMIKRSFKTVFETGFERVENEFNSGSMDRLKEIEQQMTEKDKQIAEQLREKDKQIAELLKQMADKDKIISDMAIGQNQLMILLKSEQEKSQTLLALMDNTKPPDLNETEHQETVQAEKPLKKSLWERLIGDK